MAVGVFFLVVATTALVSAFPMPQQLPQMAGMDGGVEAMMISQMPQMGGMDSIVPVNGMPHTRRHHPGAPPSQGGMPGEQFMHQQQQQQQFMLQREMQHQGGYPNIHQVVGGRMPIPQMGGVSMMNPINAVVHNPYTPQPYGYGAYGQSSSPYGQIQGGAHGRVDDLE